MKLIISGREYPAVNPGTANLLHLMELRAQTREWTEDGRGLGMRALEAMQRRGAAHQRIVESMQAQGRPVEDLEAPEDAELWMAVLLFLARRGAGEKVTFAQAADVPMGEIEGVLEPGDVKAGDEPDPQSPGSGGPATPEAPAAAAG